MILRHSILKIIPKMTLRFMSLKSSTINYTQPIINKYLDPLSSKKINTKYYLITN